MGDGRLVLTDVDRLVEYIEGKRLVSLERASKDLNLPLKTVESLTSLLEEEEIIHITYKFTTPYLNFGPPEKKRKKGEAKKSRNIIITKGGKEEPVRKAIELSTSVHPLKPMRDTGEFTSFDTAGPEGPDESGPADAMGKQISETPATRKARMDIAQLVARTNELIQKGDVDGARAIFFEIKHKKEGLSKEYLQEEHKLQDSIGRLNEYFIMGSDKAIKTKFDEKFSHISELIDQAEDKSKKGITTHEQLDAVEELYLQVKHEYLALPEGFIERRVALQDRLLLLYKNIILSKKKILTAEFDGKSRKILDLMKVTADNINHNDFDAAHKSFDEINVLYRELPDGFLKEKTELQNKILDMYQTLIIGSAGVDQNKVDAEAKFVKHKIDECNRLVAQKKFDSAREAYDEITNHYANLPEGYIALKADLEASIVDLHHMISMQLNSAALADMSVKLKKIKGLLADCERGCKKKDYALAQQMYVSAVQLYNSLPRGYSELIPYQKQLFAAYKEILPHIASLPGDADKGTKGMHQMILQILARIRGSIDSGNFDLIRDAYMQAHQIYSTLPVAFVDKESGLHAEMLRVYEEASLISLVDKLAMAAEQENFEVMRLALDKLAYLTAKVEPKYPQDKALFDYVNKRSMIFQKLLDERGGMGPQSGEEVKARMESYNEDLGKAHAMPPLQDHFDEEALAPERQAASVAPTQPNQFGANGMPPLDADFDGEVQDNFGDIGDINNDAFSELDDMEELGEPPVPAPSPDMSDFEDMPPLNPNQPQSIRDIPIPPKKKGFFGRFNK